MGEGKRAALQPLHRQTQTRVTRPCLNLSLRTFRQLFLSPSDAPHAPETPTGSILSLHYSWESQLYKIPSCIRLICTIQQVDRGQVGLCKNTTCTRNVEEFLNITAIGYGQNLTVLFKSASFCPQVFGYR